MSVKKGENPREALASSAVELVEVESQGLEIELKDLYAPTGKYSPEEKIAAVMAYMVTGTSRKASKMTGVPETTIRWWKASSSWWPDVMMECRRKKQDELDAAFSNVIEAAIGQIENRVLEGDTVVTKDGDKVQVPMRGKELAVTLAVIFDKRQLLRGDPTQRVERTNEKERLDRLQNRFEEIARSVNAKTINSDDYDVVQEEIEHGE